MASVNKPIKLKIKDVIPTYRISEYNSRIISIIKPKIIKAPKAK